MWADSELIHVALALLKIKVYQDAFISVFTDMTTEFFKDHCSLPVSPLRSSVQLLLTIWYIFTSIHLYVKPLTWTLRWEVFHGLSKKPTKKTPNFLCQYIDSCRVIWAYTCNFSLSGCDGIKWKCAKCYTGDLQSSRLPKHK